MSVGVVSTLWLPHLFAPSLDNNVKRHPPNRVNQNGSHSKGTTKTIMFNFRKINTERRVANLPYIYKKIILASFGVITKLHIT